MEEVIIVEKEIMEQPANQKGGEGSKQIAAAVLIAGILIAGAVLLKDSSAPQVSDKNSNLAQINLKEVGGNDRTLGESSAKIKLVMYEDFQCPFCGRFFNDTEQQLKTSYIKNGQVQLVYRDFAFLGPESVRTAEAAWCAHEQNKFWEYHEYLFTHQNGENEGAFSDPNLKSFARTLGLNTPDFNKCLDSNKYAETVNISKTEAMNAGVTGTPKGFIVMDRDISNKTQNEIKKALNMNPGSQPIISFYANKKIMSLNGALPFQMVKTILDILLK
jgi:protein-disulfide isomerase